MNSSSFLRLLCIAFIIGFSKMVSAQETVEISGKVLDGKDNSPVIGAAIVVKGATKGAIADIDGKFKISLPDKKASLSISFLGYETKTVAVGDSSNNITIFLFEEQKQLQEVVVTAVAIKREKKELGFATQEIKTQEITDSKEGNVINALSSKVAGMLVNATSGSPGAAARFTLRGNASINGNNEALMVVDGIPIDNSGGDATRSLEGSNRGIDINPDDIESVTILKGPAASALYGVRAANGAIMITTKSGKSGKTTVNFSSSLGFDYVNKLPEKQTLYAGGNGGVFTPFASRQNSSGDARSWGPAYNQLRYDGNTSKWDSRGDIIQSNNQNLAPVNRYDNLNNFFTQGLYRDLHLSISGGNEKTSFYFSAANFRQTGVIPNQIFERNSIKLSGSNQINKIFKITGSANYIITDASRLRKAGNWSAPIVSLLRSPDDMDNANGYSDPLNTPAAYSFVGETNAAIYQRKNAVFDNPYFSVNNNLSTENVNRFLGFVQLDADIHPMIKVVGRVGTDVYFTSTTENYSKYSAESHNESSYKGSYFESSSSYKSVNTDVFLKFTPKISDDFDLALVLGNNASVLSRNSQGLQGYDYLIPNFNDFTNTDQAKLVPSWSDSKSALVGNYLDAKIGYKNLVYLNITDRLEWSSKIPQVHNPYNTFASNLSFIASDLLPQNNILSFWKIRSSFSQGAANPQIYRTNTYFTSAVTGGFQGQTLYRSQATAGNANIKPEIQNTVEFGTEAKFLKNRIGLDATVYFSKNENQILTSFVPVSTGFEQSLVNDGYIKNVGLEVLFNATPVKKDITWDVNLTFTHQKSEINGLTNNYQSFGGSAGFSQGYTGAVNGYQYGMILGASRFERYGQDVNDMTIRNDLPIVVDATGMPKIQTPPSGKAYIVGNPNPDWFGGIRNTVTYKNFSISMLWDIRQGGQVFNLTRLNMLAVGTAKETEDRDIAQVLPNTVFADGSANNVAIKKDRTYYGNLGGDFGNVPERGIEDASWQRLRELTLRYSLPSNILEKVYIKSASISFTARNLLLFTAYKGVDPETNAAGNDPSFGRDAFNNPNTKSYVMTLNLSF